MSMRNGHLRRFVAVCLAGLLAAAGLLAPAAPASARPPDRDLRGPGWDGGRGPVYGRPPHGHVVVRHGSHPYYYHHGYYYRPYPRGGYVVVRPPVGLFIAALPIGFATLTLGGMTYYSYAGVYYRPAPGGYVVVDPPAGYVAAPPPPPVVVHQPPAAVGDPSQVAAASVTVITPSLNLRSGPGLNFPVVTVAAQGEILQVLGNAPGWLWVETQAGQTGWVAQHYTAPVVDSGASG
ncbi:MAG: DUF6515 family protein [Thermodesulfobacteriota bacterium]